MYMIYDGILETMYYSESYETKTTLSFHFYSSEVTQ